MGNRTSILQRRTRANQNVTLVIGTVVPEPSTWAMMLIGFAGLGYLGYGIVPSIVRGTR